jgi:hypothetical protein
VDDPGVVPPSCSEVTQADDTAGETADLTTASPTTSTPTETADPTAATTSASETTDSASPTDTGCAG